MGVRVWWVTRTLRVPVEGGLTHDPQPAAWYQWSGTGPGLGATPNTGPRRHPQHKGHLMQPCGLNRTWLCGGHNLHLGLSDLYVPNPNQEPQSNNKCTYGDKGQWTLNQSCHGTSGLREHRVFVCAQARTRSAPLQGSGPAGGGEMGSHHS